MDTAGRRAVSGLPSLLDAPAEIGQTTAYVIGRTRNLRSGLVILLLSGPRNQIGAGNAAGQPGSGDPAGGRLLDPLGLAYEFVVGRLAPGAGDRGLGRTTPGHGRNGHTGGLRSGRCLRLGGLPATLARTVEPVGLQGVVQRRTTVPGTGRRQGLRLLGQRGTVRSLARRGGRRTRGAEVVAVQAALARGGEPLALVLALLERRVEVGPRELGGARRVLGLPAVLLVLRRVEVRAGELGGRARVLEAVHRGVVRRVLAGGRGLGELAGGLVLLVAARGVHAPVGGLGALLRGAAGQLGTRTAGRRQLTAGAAGPLETALAAGAVLLVPGLLRLRGAGALLVLRLAEQVLLTALLVLLVLRGERVLAAALAGGGRSAVTEQVGLTRLRTAGGLALTAAGAEPGAVAEGAGEAAALALRLLAGEALALVAVLLAVLPRGEGGARPEPAPTWPRWPPGAEPRLLPPGPPGPPPGR